MDRVAVFDNDGTLSCEMPLYTQVAFALDRAAALGHPISPEELRTGGMPALVALVQLTHGSVSTDDFDDACRAWIASSVHPDSGRSYSSMVYRPMLELLELLGANDFSCWIFSGGGTDFMRTWAPGVFGLPPHRVIGSTGSVDFTVSDSGPRLMKGVDVQIVDDGDQKPISIHRSVGQRPLLAAGNTDGDLPMLQWSAASPHRSLQLIVRHTDAAREYAYEQDPLLGSGTVALTGEAARGGWTVVDMAEDWATVFGEHPQD